MTTLRQHFRHLWGSATAVPRTLREYVRFRRSWKDIRDRLPQGDGHPVLVLPGMMTGDFFYKTFRKRLAEKGYQPHGWEGGINMGLSRKTAETLAARIEEVFEAGGGQKITLIGHSLGGIYARELAREYPEMVRDVITMGAPFGGMAGGDAVPGLLRKIFNRFSDAHIWNAPDIDARGLTPPPAPSTSIYSKDDVIIKWQACLNPDADHCENIVVSTTHMGLPFCPSSLVAIFDRLAQKDGDWKRFDAATYEKVDAAAYHPAPAQADLPKNPQWAATDAPRSGNLFRKR